jgi:uncharacterized membrane protein
MIEPGAALRTKEFNAAELGALAHLYRGEVYRSTIWRTRLDTTTNWAVVTLGVALSITYSSPGASPLPLVLIGVLIFLFLIHEARRYRYFNVWRARCRWMERHIYVPMLYEGDLHMEQSWHQTLANDYLRPQYHVTFMTALGRRVRRNYLWILLIQTLAYLGKIIVHPIAATDVDTVLSRAGIGPAPGWLVLAAGAVYLGAGIGIAIWSKVTDGRKHRRRGTDGMG